MVGDHETSDRDCDGFDSPHVWNDLTGATSASSTGLFGIWFRVDGLSNQGSEDWFDDGTDNNTETDPADPIINGPFGSGAGGLGLFGSTSMELNPADNPTAAAHVWRTGQAHNNSRVTFATASYGSGRVAAIGDSSPADDSSGDPGDTLYPGWDLATGGVKNREIHLNACAWLLNPAPDTTPPAITAGPAAAPSDCSALVTWTTDEAATSLVDYGVSSAYGLSASAPGRAQSHAVPLAGLLPSTLYHYSVSSTDAAGNGPTRSTDATFTTSAAAAPVIIAGPSAASITGLSAAILWTTDEASSSEVQYGTTPSYGSTASGTGGVTGHSVTLGGLTPSTLYHYRVLSTDACGNGPVLSGDGTFTTGPASIDVSGYTLKQYNSAQTFVIPAGTTIPSGGYLVVARDATLAQFQAYFASMPSGTVFLDSNATGSCGSAGCFPQINGGESFELYSAANALLDGPTISLVSTGVSYQRTNPADPAGLPASWSIVDQSLANPGQGAGTPGGAGLRINEFADAADFTKEFVELYYDAGIAPPDTIPPAAITDLVATPESSSGIRLGWTASGNDGATGTAASYDVRMSPLPILTEADFAAATPLADAPAPHTAGTPEQFAVGGLTADTSYCFALKVSDGALNRSSLSNSDCGTTARAGSGPPEANHLVISQIQTAGDGTPSADDEFIELYNPTGSALPLSGLSVQYKSATGTTHTVLPLPALSIPSKGWLLLARSAYNGPASADAGNTAFLMAAAGGNLFLVNGTSALPASSCSTSALIIDKVAWGTGNCPETAAPAAPAANNGIDRKPGGTLGSGQDTDNNASDFQAQVPSAPHNRFSTPATPPSGLGNVGNTLFLRSLPAGTDLDWANAAAATAYRVYRGTAPGFMSGSPAPWMTAATSRLTDATLPAPGTALFYVARATDGVTESPY